LKIVFSLYLPIIENSVLAILQKELIRNKYYYVAISIVEIKIQKS